MFENIELIDQAFSSNTCAHYQLGSTTITYRLVLDKVLQRTPSSYHSCCIYSHGTVIPLANDGVHPTSSHACMTLLVLVVDILSHCFPDHWH